MLVLIFKLDGRASNLTNMPVRRAGVVRVNDECLESCMIVVPNITVMMVEFCRTTRK